MKRCFALFTLILFWSFGSWAQVWDYQELTDNLGYKSYRSDLFSAEEKNFLHFYSGYGYGIVNSHLRGTPIPPNPFPYEPKKVIEIIDQAMERLPEIPPKLLYFRGEDLSYRGNRPFHKNEIVIQPAYMSTSTDPQIAGQFSLKGIFWILYSTQKFHRGIAMGSDEREILLPHGLVTKVMDIRSSPGNSMVYVGVAQICDSLATCEDTISNEYVQTEWERKWEEILVLPSK